MSDTPTAPAMRLARCHDCAFTLGTAANASPMQAHKAEMCALIGEPFYCHVGPERLCAGWAQSVLDSETAPRDVPEWKRELISEMLSWIQSVEDRDTAGTLPSEDTLERELLETIQATGFQQSHNGDAKLAMSTLPISKVNPDEEIARLLKEHQAVLTRTKRHLVYKFPDGRMYTQSCTPSDFRAANNQLRDLRRILNLNGTRGLPGERREKVLKPGRAEETRIRTSMDGHMLEAMRKAGLVEARLHDKIAALTIQLRLSRQANTRRRVALKAIQGHCPKCWWCKLKHRFRRFMIRIDRGM